MKEFLHTIFGDYTGVQMLGYLWFFIIGYIIYGLNEVSNRDVESIKTPRKWSWGFFWRDNAKRYIVTILSTYILFIFYTKMTNHIFETLDAFILGYMGDNCGKILKDKISIVSANREELMKRHLENELNKNNEPNKEN